MTSSSKVREKTLLKKEKNEETDHLGEEPGSKPAHTTKMTVSGNHRVYTNSASSGFAAELCIATSGALLGWWERPFRGSIA